MAQEPKAHRFWDYDEIRTDAIAGSLYYLKSEADKVIAELKEECNWLAKDRAQAYDDLEKRAQLNIKQEKSIRRQKYKRCLSMAKLCQWKMGVFIYHKEKNEFYYRWHKRWLELAEKFKEAK